RTRGRRGPVAAPRHGSHTASRRVPGKRRSGPLRGTLAQSVAAPRVDVGGTMHRATPSSRRVSRRSLLRATAGVVTAAGTTSVTTGSTLARPRVGQGTPRPGSQAAPATPNEPLFRALDEQIEAAMGRY